MGLNSWLLEATFDMRSFLENPPEGKQRETKNKRELDTEGQKAKHNPILNKTKNLK